MQDGRFGLDSAPRCHKFRCWQSAIQLRPKTGCIDQGYTTSDQVSHCIAHHFITNKRSRCGASTRCDTSCLSSSASGFSKFSLSFCSRCSNMFCFSLMLLCCHSSSAPGYSSQVLSSSASGFSSQVLFRFASALQDFHITFRFSYNMLCFFYTMLGFFYPPLCFFPKSLCLSSCHNALPQSWLQSIVCIGWYDAFILLLFIGYSQAFG